MDKHEIMQFLKDHKDVRSFAITFGDSTSNLDVQRWSDEEWFDGQEQKLKGHFMEEEKGKIELEQKGTVL